MTCPCLFLSDALRGRGWNVSLRMRGVRFQLPLRPRHFSRTSDAHASVSLSVCARAHAGVGASVSPPSSSYFVQLLQLTDPPLSPSKCWTCKAVRRSVVCTPHTPTHTQAYSHPHTHIPTPTHISPHTRVFTCPLPPTPVVPRTVGPHTHHTCTWGGCCPQSGAREYSVR